MHTCKTHLVGTQKRKTHIIAGVLTILGCISGVYGGATTGGSGAAGTAPPASPRSGTQTTKSMGGASEATVDVANREVVNEAADGLYRALIQKNDTRPTPPESPRSASKTTKSMGGASEATVDTRPTPPESPRSAGGNGEAVSTAGGDAAGVGKDGAYYTFALPSGDKMILHGITGDTKLGDLFAQLYEKAKLEYERTKLPHYDWSGPKIIRITAEDGKIVHELHGDIYNEKLKDVFGNHANLIITRGAPVQDDIEVKEFTITDQVLRGLLTHGIA